MNTNTVLALALALTSLDLSKQKNAPLREVMLWEEVCEALASRAYYRVMQYAIEASHE